MLSIHKTGDEFYSSGGAIDTGVTMAVVCLSSWDARIYALGIKQ